MFYLLHLFKANTWGLKWRKPSLHASWQKSDWSRLSSHDLLQHKAPGFEISYRGLPLNHWWEKSVMLSSQISSYIPLDWSTERSIVTIVTLKHFTWHDIKKCKCFCQDYVNFLHKSKTIVEEVSFSRQWSHDLSIEVRYLCKFTFFKHLSKFIAYHHPSTLKTGPLLRHPISIS